MDPEYEWNKLIVLEQLSDYGKGKFQEMTKETQEALVYDAMISELFRGAFPINQA